MEVTLSRSRPVYNSAFLFYYLTFFLFSSFSLSSSFHLVIDWMEFLSRCRWRTKAHRCIFTNPTELTVDPLKFLYRPHIDKWKLECNTMGTDRGIYQYYTRETRCVFKVALRSGASYLLSFPHLRSKRVAERTKKTNELSWFNFIDYALLFFEREHGIILWEKQR